jgi:hypothetical protein
MNTHWYARLFLLAIVLIALFGIAVVLFQVQ